MSRVGSSVFARPCKTDTPDILSVVVSVIGDLKGCNKDDNRDFTLRVLRVAEGQGRFETKLAGCSDAISVDCARTHSNRQTDTKEIFKGLAGICLNVKGLWAG